MTVIDATDTTTDDPEANAFEYLIPVTDVDAALRSLEEAGIGDFTLNREARTISLLNFARNEDGEFDDTGVRKMINNLRNKLIKIECYDTGRKEIHKKIKSGYFDRQARRNKYKAWLTKASVGRAGSDPSQNNSEDSRAEESLIRLISYALESLGDSYKSQTELNLMKARSGVYADTPENRRLHRVDQRYGTPRHEDGASTEKDDNNGTNEYTDRLSKEFRSLQKRSLRLSDAEVRGFHSGSTEPDERLRRRLSRILGKQIASFRSSDRYDDSSFVNKKHGTTFEILSDVNPRLFHDVIQIVRQYLYSGDTVDVHDDYSEAKCYLSTDGLAGFVIEPDGNLVSVFSLKKGFTTTCGKYMVEQGARKLDCYQSRLIDLPAVYKHTLGFEVASILDFNREMLEEDRGREYADHFVSTYGESPVMFMVRGENIPVRHFGKDDYDDAVAYQNSFLDDKSVHKSLTELNLMKARSGVYADTPENRRLHRVGQRYGTPRRDRERFDERERRSEMVKEFRQLGEEFLSSMEGDRL